MAKEKKIKPIIQKKYEKYNGGSIGCKVGKYASLLTPYLVLGGVNFNEWFNQEKGWATSLGFGLAMAVFGVGTWINAKKDLEESKIGKSAVIVVGWFCVCAVFYFLSAIINDIAMIMFWGGMGMLGALGFDIGSNTLNEKAKIYKQAMQDNGIMEDLEKDKALKEEAQRLAEEEVKRRAID